MNDIPAPTGPNNKANTYYARQEHIKIAKVDSNRTEFFGTIGGVPDSPITIAPGGVTPGYEYLEGQALQDDPNYDQIQLPTNYESSEGTITVVESRVDGVQQPKTYVVSAGERVTQWVEDSAGNTREWVVDASVAAEVVPGIIGIPEIDDTTPLVGETLTVTPADMTGSPDPTASYIWRAGATSVGTGTTLLVTSSMISEIITVEQIASNGISPDATATSIPTDPVVAAPAAPVITGVPTIDDMTPNVGDTLTAEIAPTTGNPVPTITLTWLADGSSIGTGTTYVVQSGDENKVITVRQDAVNGVLPDATATSDPTAPVGPEFEAPTITTLPTINNTSPVVGDLLLVTAGDTTGNPTPTNTFVWFAGVVQVGTGPTYLVQAGDSGEAITVRQDADNGVPPTDSATSAATNPVQSAGFDPAVLYQGGEVGWWLENDISTMWQDQSRTLPVTASGQPITVWNDKSPNAYHMVDTSSPTPTEYTEDAGRTFLKFFPGHSGYELETNTQVTDGAILSFFIGMRTIDDVGVVYTTLSSGVYAGSVNPAGGSPHSGWPDIPLYSVDLDPVIPNAQRDELITAWSTGVDVSANIENIDYTGLTGTARTPNVLRYSGFDIACDVYCIIVTEKATADLYRTEIINYVKNPGGAAPGPTIQLTPRTTDTFVGDFFSVDETYLTNVTARQWRIVGGANLGTGATQEALPGNEGEYVVCDITCDQGNLTSTPSRVNKVATMMGHDVDNRAMLATCKAVESTIVTVASGQWSDPTIWNLQRIPEDGDRVYITNGHAVVYDVVDVAPRLDWLRVDGDISIDTSTAAGKNFKFHYETCLVWWGGTRRYGNGPTDRLPDDASIDITISDRDYRTDPNNPTDLRAETFAETRLWGRGDLTLGDSEMWAKDRRTWSPADAPVPVGATDLTLQRTPDGWKIGDTIIIGSTTSYYTIGEQMGRQDEYRVITNIIGNQIFWTDPLVWPHDNQDPDSTRTDVYPAVSCLSNSNIQIRSESNTVPHRQGHVACAHPDFRGGFWNVDFIDLGRADKSQNVGVIDDDGNFKYYDKFGTNITQIEPLTATSNVNGKYALHFHHCGDRVAAGLPVPIADGCCVDGAVGWGFVHHVGDVQLDNSVAHAFFGAGFSSEQGNETNSWVGNLAIHTSNHNQWPDNVHLGSNVKNLETFQGIAGADTAKFGYGFFFRGRAMRTNRNWAVSCGNGHVFFHRDIAATDSRSTQPALPLNRNSIDLQTLGLIKLASLPDTLGYGLYPIVHFDGNEAMACYSGGFISKGDPTARHDANVKLRRFRAIGCNNGFLPEYIGTYIFDRFDVMAGAPGEGGIGLSSGGNIFQFMWVDSRVEGYPTGIFISGQDTGGTSHDKFTQGDPRFGVVGMDFVRCTTEVAYSQPSSSTKTTEDVTYINSDWADSYVDYNLVPSDNFPDTIAPWDRFDNAVFDNAKPNNTQGNKIDNHSSVAELIPKPWNDTSFPENNTELTQWALNADFGGVWYVDGNPKLIYADIGSDRITGRPYKKTRMLDCINVAGIPDRGAFEFSTNPVVQSDFAITYDAADAATGYKDIDILTGATGGNGTYAIDFADYYVDSIKPNHGTATTDGTNIRYTPDRDYVGTDEFFYPIISAGQYAFVRITVLVLGDVAEFDALVSGTNFTAAGGTGVLIVDTRAPAHVYPSVGGREVRSLQYTLDGGATVKRVCHGWVPAVHTLTTESDASNNNAGTPLTPGSYNIQFRVITDFDDYDTGTAWSTAVPVTVA